MIDGRIVAEHLRGGRKATFMIDHGVGVENVLLVLVLNMNERVGGRDPLGECLCRDAFALRAAIGMRGRREIARAEVVPGEG